MGRCDPAPLPRSAAPMTEANVSMLRRLLLGGTAAGAALLATRAFTAGAADRDGAASPRGDERPFSFGFIGDTPYSRLEADALGRVLAAMEPEPLEFVLHVGDIKSSRESCDDDLLASRLALLDECPHPLILTPGDNEWTDCGRRLPPWDRGGRLERLEWLRGHAFYRASSLGRRRMAVQQQGPYHPHRRNGNGNGIDNGTGGGDDGPPKLPENLRWRVGSLQFCTLHVVGSNNARADKEPALERAWLLRQQANAEWLNDTVQLARRERARGLAIALHANMRFERDHRDGWTLMRSLVVAAAVAFDGPVLLLHGDTHVFQSDRLLLRSHGLANFRRVECFGSPFSSSWVQIRWDPELARPGAGEASDPFQVSIRSLP